MAGSLQFDPGLIVQLPGPMTRLRRSGSELILDLPLVPRLGRGHGLGELLPPERLARLALRAAPVAVALAGAVALSSLLNRPKSLPSAESASPLPGAPAAVGAGGRSAEIGIAPGPAAPRTPAEAAPRVASLEQVKATLVDGKAVLPEGAPPVLEKVAAAANEIADSPYSYGGGHGSFESEGYDCSGAVSYALHGGGLLDSPLASGGLASWGEPGPGKAITVYANGGHVFAMIAGLRWDTSGTGGSGPSWHRETRSTADYTVRHPAGY